MTPLGYGNTKGNGKRVIPDLLGGDGLGPEINVSEWSLINKVGLYSQVPREIDIEAVLNSQVVTKELQGDDVQKPLQNINGLGYTDGLDTLLDVIVTFVADNDRLSFASCDLCEGRLDLGV